MKNLDTLKKEILMNKEELEQRINELQSELNNLQSKLRNLDSYERFIPEEREIYWFIDDEGKIIPSRNTHLHHCVDNSRIDFYNCFRTKEEAEREKEKILVRRMLENIANRLNKGKKIDFGDLTSKKYFICFDYDRNFIRLNHSSWLQAAGAVYCLSDKFLEVAIEEIDEERLIKYIRYQ